MRILLTADPELPVPPTHYGGIERIVDSLVRSFAGDGHHTGLVANGESLSPAHRLYAWPGSSSRSRRDSLANSLALRRAVQDFNPDIVHSFSRLGYLASIARRPIPKIMSYQRHTGGFGVRLAARAYKHLHFTGCSEFIAAQGRRAGGNWAAVPNFVDLNTLQFASEIPPDSPLVFLSRIEAIKGAHLAIAIAKRAGRRLILAGNHASNGAEAAYWKNTIEPELGKNGIEYVGPVNDAQKNQLLGRSAALLVPIQWDEPFGIVFAEALACGTPVISCARGALPEIVEDGVHGFLIQSVEEGVRAVEQLDRIDRRRCRERVEAHFSAPVVARQYLNLYEAAVAAAGR